MRYLVGLAVLAGGVAATAAGAVAVINPIAPVQMGARVRVEPFTTVPASATKVPRTGAQGLRGPADGSGRLFVNDTRGVLYVTSQAGAPPTTYLDLRTQGIGFSNAAEVNQTGLMGFAFHPNFNRNPAQPGYRSFYTIDTTAPSGGGWGAAGSANHDNVVREWTVADPAAASAQVTATREVLRVAQPFKDHGAGTIGFNPGAQEGDGDYGKLYIGLGDGGGINDPLDNAQNLRSPFGKILRIDPADPDGAGPLTYSVPDDNPFVQDKDARGEVWALGLRNPQQFSWNAGGNMLIADIGQAQIEEVNVGTAGANYGWPLREGTFERSRNKADSNIYQPTPGEPNPYTDPIAQYDHEEITRDGMAELAAIGGVFRYEGSLVPELVGKVVLTDLVAGRLFYYDPAVRGTDGTATLRELGLVLGNDPFVLRDAEGYGSRSRVDLRLGVDPDGELYLVTKGRGAIYRITGSGVPEPASWAMMVAGFGLAGGALRRRRRHPA